jgi:predicted dehydrogenase
MSDKIRILCVGAGNMGTSHARAYHKLDDFEIVGIVTRSPESRGKLNEELGGDYAEFADYPAALAETRPDAVSISTYPDTHALFAEAAFEAGAHVFIEKPLAESVAEAESIVAKARSTDRKSVV